jgi:hypothetical protein
MYRANNSEWISSEANQVLLRMNGLSHLIVEDDDDVVDPAIAAAVDIVRAETDFPVLPGAKPVTRTTTAWAPTSAAEPKNAADVFDDIGDAEPIKMNGTAAPIPAN